MSKSPSAKPWPLYVILACSLLLNLVLFLGRGPSDDSGDVLEEDALVEDAVMEDAGMDGEPAAGGLAAPAAGAVIGTTDTAPGVPTQAANDSAAAGGWTVLHADVESSLARTFQIGAGESGDALSGVFARLYVWDLDLRRDLKAGDPVSVVWRIGTDGFPEIAAASLQSAKLGRTLAVYRWQAPGDEFASYWYLDGTEAPLRLKDGPLAQYEQITSLLKDRPSHKGMDFKTPVGTEVTSPRAGKVTRVNWNWGANGNCVEIRFDDGVLAKFLHLSENRVKEGDSVSVGQVVALTGNTGHSTAPHLHYQLDRGDKTVDPLDYHGTDRRKLSADQIAALGQQVQEFQALLVEPAGQ